MSGDAIKSAKRLAERERMACKFEVGSAEDLPYSDGYFDKVVCSSSLEHFKDDVRALKPCMHGFKINEEKEIVT